MEAEFDDVEALLDELEPELEALMYPEKIIYDSGESDEDARARAREWSDITKRHGGIIREEDEIEERQKLPGLADSRIMFKGD